MTVDEPIFLKGMVQFTKAAKEDMKKRKDEEFNETLSRRGRLIESVFAQAELLDTPVKQGLFIPCDLEGNILPLPAEHLENRNLYYQELKIYQEALKRVLFKGFYIEESKPDKFGNTIKAITNGVVYVYWHNVDRGWYVSHGIYKVEDLAKFNLELERHD
jgi:hypothetical protein